VNETLRGESGCNRGGDHNIVDGMRCSGEARPGVLKLHIDDVQLFEVSGAALTVRPGCLPNPSFIR